MMSKEVRSISLPGRAVLGGGRVENLGMRTGMSSFKEKRSNRGNEKEKEIEVRTYSLNFKSYIFGLLPSMQIEN